MRVKFAREKQRAFLLQVMKNVGAPSLRELSRRLDISYSTLKNYFIEARLMPEALYERLVVIFKIRGKVRFVSNSWGQAKGGKVRKRIIKQFCFFFI